MPRLRKIPEGIARNSVGRAAPLSLEGSKAAAPKAPVPATPTVHLVDDDDAVRDAVGVLLRTRGLAVRDYASAEAFLAGAPAEARGCVLTDVQMPAMSGLDLLEQMADRRLSLPVIVMTGRADRRMAVEAVRQGALAFIEKPFHPDEILAAVRRAMGLA
jgi:two-component system, LuxR family, response regulator FixJ